MEDYLQDLEPNHITLANSEKISEAIRSYIEVNTENLSDQEKGDLELERQVLIFGIDKMQIIPKHSEHDYNGNVLTSFPDIRLFKPEAFQYIKERFRETENYVIKAHFGHFLHLNGERHQTYLKEAQINYAKIIDQLLAYNIANKGHSLENEFYHQIIFYIRQYEYVSVLLKSVDDYKVLLLGILENSDHSYLWYPIMYNIIGSKKIFKEEEIEQLSQQLLDLANSQERDLDKIAHYKLGDKLDAKIHKSTANWKELQAISYESLATERDDLAAIEFANKAARLYEISGNMEGSLRMAEVYRDKSKNIDLSKFTRSEDVTDYANETFQIIDKLKELNIDEIIEFLSDGQELIIPFESLEEKAKEEMEENRFKYLMGHQIIDSNGHPSKHYSTPEELMEFAKFTVYGLELQKLFQYRIDPILHYLISERDDWTSSKLIEYLSENTWYGAPINQSPDSTQHSTIELLAPGISNYFVELRKFLKNPDDVFNFTLCMDSLTMKIEGILRTLCNNLGIQTFSIKPDDNNRNVTKELDINILIRKTNLVNLLGEDLVYFMKYVLVERSGFNLRNSIAHSFLKPDNYKVFSFMNMLIIILMKVSKSQEATQSENEL